MTTQTDLNSNNSYPAVVKEIIEKIMSAKADTLTGSELLKEVYKNLSESKNITPLLTLKPFITGSEKIAGDDVSLKEIVDFIKRKVTTNADLSFLIGLVKEEHFQNLLRSGHPAPQTTIKDFEDEFGKPSSVIEQGIKNGIFDTMKSNLLNKIKTDLTKVDDKMPVTVKLNESETVYFENLAKYSPVGIKLDDVKNNRMIILTESCNLQYDYKTKDLKALSESEVEISPAHKNLMHSINSLGYNPKNNSFSLNENWDFNLELQPSGEIFIGKNESSMKLIPKEKVADLLLESIKAYELDGTKIQGFNKQIFLKDADNFIALMENHSNLIKLDNLEVIKNLNENSFVLFEKDLTTNDGTKQPKVLFVSSTSPLEKPKQNQLFESYIQLNNSLSDFFGTKISGLFESQINFENTLIQENQTKINKLVEEQKSLNENINKVNSLKSIADQNSPALIKLNEQSEVLNSKLEQNLKSLNECQNEFKLR